MKNRKVCGLQRKVRLAVEREAESSRNGKESEWSSPILRCRSRRRVSRSCQRVTLQAITSPLMSDAHCCRGIDLSHGECTSHLIWPWFDCPMLLISTPVEISIHLTCHSGRVAPPTTLSVVCYNRKRSVPKYDVKTIFYFPVLLLAQYTIDAFSAAPF